MKTAAIIMAAGLGTRMKSSLPKVLHPVLGRPMVCYPIDLALGLGSSQVVIVVGQGRERVEAVVKARFPEADLAFALQAEQLGTAHAVMCGASVLHADITRVIVLTGDAPNLTTATFETLLEDVQSSKAAAGLVTAELDDPTGYGRLIRDDDGRPQRIVEHRDASEAEREIREINSGFYVFERAFLDQHLTSVDTGNDQGELYLTDLIALAKSDGRAVCAVCTDDPCETLGINSRVELAEAEATARGRRNLALMRDGVTLVDPSRVIVEADVDISPDVTIEPGAMLMGRTRVGQGTTIEAGAIIRDSAIGEGCCVKAYSHLEGATLESDVVVGPFARLRPGTVMKRRSFVGNFVEVKKSVIGEGTKAGHLSYLGDAEIGAGVNVGAGTITCNYDGKNKNRTVIGEGAFIGSDTQLVAPVTVGKRAYVAAGTTVTKDVPDAALALTRPKQVHIEGFADRDRGDE